MTTTRGILQQKVLNVEITVLIIYSGVSSGGPRGNLQYL